jgi:predicted metal-dependent hydrolase
MVVQAHHDLALPRWAYVPGKQPAADHDALERAKALVPVRYDGFVPASDPALRYGLALNDGGFFWEAHEILEAIWKVAPQGGRDRILLRACIQVANANLKMKMDRPRAALRLLLDAAMELDEVAVRARSGASIGFAGSFAVDCLNSSIRERLTKEYRDTGPVCFVVT